MAPSGISSEKARLREQARDGLGRFGQQRARPDTPDAAGSNTAAGDTGDEANLSAVSALVRATFHKVWAAWEGWDTKSDAWVRGEREKSALQFERDGHISMPSRHISIVAEGVKRGLWDAPDWAR